MKKCIITGHTGGLGKYLFDHFQSKGWNVVGMSTSTGYDISKDMDKIVNESIGCDLFINNASYNTCQLDLLSRLCKKIPKIITIGDSGADFVNLWDIKFTKDMLEVEKGYNLITLSDDPKIADTLLIKVAFVEKSYTTIEKPNRIDSDYVVHYSEISNAIDFWIDNPKIKLIEFKIKLTDYTVENIKQMTNKPEMVNQIIENVKKLTDI